MAKRRRTPLYGAHRSVRGAVEALVIDEPHLTRSQIAERLHVSIDRVRTALAASGFLGTSDEDRHPCGDPGASDRLLEALRCCHPAGHEDAAPEPMARWHGGSSGWRSLTGCSAAVAAEAA